ncbi:anhydro-N-acetylmuramic acid kinase [Ulvibacterium marinum]|uniref:Anhydro-N-acetylmuramic acid kinase n=1 Tax=Ulvibacterium marinum TaxID=2419782 RepID=A0A3B0BWM2_9FLAO|nr:anhydro-N-acetylmuramic acid kinase [Ulvibacterium marinum]RKN76881.1 anhydro-N-acetylmuramic acid kinase [Ulvibacterium marinum]
MKNTMYRVIGLMSGTSLDGLDLAFCHIYEQGGYWKFEIRETQSVSYTTEMKSKLKDSIHLSAEELLVLHNEYGTWLGEQAQSFINEFNLDVDAIASHGHTTHHKPEMGLTFQIGSGQHLANACGHQVICDFRTNDVSIGGQGAPLVPIGDRLFFGQYDFCLNLGGISNVSFEKNGKRIAYDIGQANMILNHITQKIGLNYDPGGEIAGKGALNPQMLQELNALEYYGLPYPKSTGYEWFIEKIVPIVDATEDSIENLLHTAIHHNCHQIANQIHMNKTKKDNTLFVTGGGALNTFFIEELQVQLGNDIEVVIPSKKLVEFKEALVFSLMGVLRLRNETNVLGSVTGAMQDSSSGVVYLPC